MSGGRGGARPGAGRKKGQMSQAKIDIMSAAREFALEALMVLKTVAQDPAAPAAARVSAANSILDRGFGKAEAIVEPAPRDTLAEALEQIWARGSKAPIHRREAG
jgi:hypothetical protein